MATLMSLPNELLLMIAKSTETFTTEYSTQDERQILGLEDLMNLTYVNRRLNSIMNDVLYRLDRDVLGFHAPIHAVYNDSVETLELMDRLGFNLLDEVELRPAHGILNRACEFGHVEIVGWLLDKGFPMKKIPANQPPANQASLFSSSQLVTAILQRQAEIAIFLLSRGATPRFMVSDDPDDYDNVTTALHLAASHDVPEVVKYIVQNKVLPVNIRDSSGKTPLHCCIDKFSYASFWEDDTVDWDSIEPEDHWPNNTVVLRTLISLGADLNIRYRGDTLLGEALMWGAYGHAYVLLKAGAKVQPDSEVREVGSIPLYICIRHVPFEYLSMKRILLEEIIKRGADPNQQCNGVTPLQYALKYDSWETTRLLVKLGASLGLTAPDGHNILDFNLEYYEYWYSEFISHVTCLVKCGVRIDVPLVSTGEPFLVGFLDKFVENDSDIVVDYAIPNLSELIATAVDRGFDRALLNRILEKHVRCGVRGTNRAKVCKILVEVGAVLEEPQFAATAALEFIVSDYQCYTKYRNHIDDHLFDSFLSMTSMKYMKSLLTQAQGKGDERSYLKILARMGKLTDSDARRSCELIWGSVYTILKLWDLPVFPKIDYM
ncbi:ankyrin repeat-containing domain protein [Rostrohypoxylon terebratum]|nr:ankyrin repeat-containing domain protein [Rostrohypoxylon terebratum]